MIVYTVEGSHDGLIHAGAKRKEAVEKALEYIAAPVEPHHIRELEEFFQKKMEQYYRFGIYLGEKGGKTGVTITAWDNPTPVKPKHVPSGVEVGDYVDYRLDGEVVYQKEVMDVMDNYKILVEGNDGVVTPQQIVRVYHKVM